MVICLLIAFCSCAAPLQERVSTIDTTLRIWVVSDSLVGGQDDVTLEMLGTDRNATLPQIKELIENWFGGNWPSAPSRIDSAHFKRGSLFGFALRYNTARSKAILYKPSESNPQDAVSFISTVTEWD